MVRGEISVPASALTDPVILKSNLIPMYNFAVVVDDYDMDITHVIRGEEHISNTPYQIAIKNSLGFDKKDIEYGHLSVIINELGKKLSKRDTSLKQFINDYKNMGILPEAIVNFMSLLGWSNEKNKEIFSLEEATSLFNIKQVSKSPTFFDFKKMMWVSNCYFKNIDDEQYIKFVSPFVTIDLKQLESKKVEILLLFKNQICCAHELNSLITDTFFNQENKNNFNNDIIKASLLKQLQNFSDEISFDEAKNIITNIKTETKLSGKDLFMPIRILLTSCEHGPELNKIMSIMGKKNIGNKLNNM